MCVCVLAVPIYFLFFPLFLCVCFLCFLRILKMRVILLFVSFCFMPLQVFVFVVCLFVFCLLPCETTIVKFVRCSFIDVSCGF